MSIEIGSTTNQKTIVITFPGNALPTSEEREQVKKQFEDAGYRVVMIPFNSESPRAPFINEIG